jgi:hypothetical protein
MKKILLLLSLVLLTNLSFGQNSQTQKPASLAEQTKIYPNPVESTQNVNVILPQGVEVKSLSLLKMNGWSLLRWSSPNQNQQQLTLWLPKMSSGVHIFNFELKNGQTFSKKLLVGR